MLNRLHRLVEFLGGKFVQGFIPNVGVPTHGLQRLADSLLVEGQVGFRLFLKKCLRRFAEGGKLPAFFRKNAWADAPFRFRPQVPYGFAGLFEFVRS